MAHIRWMLTRAEMEAMEARNKRADGCAKRMAVEAAKLTLKAKAARKLASSGTTPTKPRCSWEMQAL